MINLNRLIHPLARIAMGILFLFAGYQKVIQGAPIAGKIEKVFPGFGFMAWPVSIFELVAGALIIIGLQTRMTALMLAGFCVITGVLFHGQADMTGMLKNIALAGGYMMLFVYGAGGLSLDRS